MNKRVLSFVLCLLLLAGMVSAQRFSVSASNIPVIMVDSAVLSPYKGSYAEVKLKVITDEEVSYQWQAGFFDSTFKPVDLDDNDYYIGTKTNHFKLKAENELDQLDFRCKITYSGGVVYSQTFNFSFIEPTNIENVTITVQKPVFCAYPDSRVLVSRNEEYSLNRVIWYSGDNLTADTIIPSGGVFVEGNYNCRVYLDSTEGYKFTEDTAVSVNVAQNGSNVYTHNTKMKVNEIGQFYAEIPFLIESSEDIPDGILGFEWYDPGIPDGALGKVYLGTDSMDIPFAFKIKTLPRSMGVAGYWTWGKTQITLNDENVYYANSGERVNLKDVATTPGRYYIYQRIYLMDPGDKTIKNDALYYVVDVLEPTVLEDLGAEITVPVGGATPADTATVCGEGYSVNDVYWHDVTDGKEVFMSKDDTFVEGHTYKAHIWLRTEEGYLLKTDSNGCPDIKASINGESAEVTYAVSDVATELTCEFTIPNVVVTDPTETTGPADLTEPSTGSEDKPTDLTEPSTDSEDKPTDPTEPSTGDDTKPSDTIEPSTGGDTKPSDTTEPSTDDDTKPSDTTEPSTGDDTKPSDPVVDKGILGDVNGDGKVNIKDATQIQKFAAKIISLTDAEQIRADVNADGKVNIKDATAIQKFVAKIETGFLIGEKIA